MIEMKISPAIPSGQTRSTEQAVVTQAREGERESRGEREKETREAEKKREGSCVRAACV